MSQLKTVFPTTDGGFNMWIPFIRTKATTITLFFHCLQHSDTICSIIRNETSLGTNSIENPSNHLFSNSSWPWLMSAVNAVNLLDIVLKISSSSLMWSYKLTCKVVIEIDQSTGEIMAHKPTFTRIYVCSPKDLRIQSSFSVAICPIEAYDVIRRRSEQQVEVLIMVSEKIPTSPVYYAL
eukprot:TRINITY_DN2456_c0_g2_i4.p1 TRINITY_DN2456_c0_g2~~TRINITY_DN2456_c0_g2_i4.p1  ORF type:complete len:180 (+),score=2.85 TRINITY_DN2456_c0_g2_i4:2218-2757(+)